MGFGSPQLQGSPDFRAVLARAKQALSSAVLGELPEHGQIVVFDRLDARVLVERVEGFATKREWRRGYEEINQFERLLVEDGIRIVKIFLHISAGEQIRRFKDRVKNPLKRWKLTYEDFRTASDGRTTKSRSKI